MPDFFASQLLECKFRGNGFPCTSFRVRIQQSIVTHARPDQDGARIESTGRNPLVFTATIPWLNNLARGPNETWGTPYPDGHRQFLADIADRSAGLLQHPSLGLVKVKTVNAESLLEATRRDGEMVTAEWIEHSDDEEASNSFLSGTSGISGAILNAVDLDERLAPTKLKKLDPDKSISFEEALRKVASVSDTASLLSRKAFGQIDRIMYRLNVIRDGIASQRDPQNWPAKEALSKLRASIQAMKTKAAKTQKDTRWYVTPAPTTAGNLAAKFRNSVGDIIRLNPELCASPEIGARVPVKYYVTTNG